MPAGEAIEEDAADIAARKRRLAAEREAAELKKRSQVTTLPSISTRQRHNCFSRNAGGVARTLEKEKEKGDREIAALCQ